MLKNNIIEWVQKLETTLNLKDKYSKIINCDFYNYRYIPLNDVSKSSGKLINIIKEKDLGNVELKGVDTGFVNLKKLLEANGGYDKVIEENKNNNIKHKITGVVLKVNNKEEFINDVKELFDKVYLYGICDITIIIQNEKTNEEFCFNSSNYLAPIKVLERCKKNYDNLINKEATPSKCIINIAFNAEEFDFNSLI